MRSISVGLLLLLGGCTWSNSLYQARRLVGEAERAERDQREFEAQSYWDQAAVKADSAFARDPSGVRGAEALWVRGRAAAKRRDCAGAIQAFDGSLILAPSAPWRESLLMSLGRCREEMGDPTALEAFLALRGSADSARRQEARRRAGHLAANSGAWQDALTLLEGERSPGARVDRAVALAGLGRTDDALAEVEPLLASADTTTRWEPLVRLLASRDAEDGDRFVERLSAQPTATPARRAEWLLAAIEGALPGDPAAAERRFAVLVTLQAPRPVGAGRLLIADLRVSQASSVDDLRRALDALGSLATAGGLAAIRIGDLRRIGGRVVAEYDSILPSTANGDLALFGLAEEARDSLNAPMLAASLFHDLETRRDSSPYVPKALIARMALLPDSAEALRARLARYADSPYLAFTRGEDDPRLVALEDALRRFLDERATRRRIAAEPVDRE